MLLQKVLHVHHDLEETKACMANLHGYRRELEGCRKAVVTADGIGRFEFTTGTGFAAQVEVQELPSSRPDQVLFQSIGGNVEVAGLIEYLAIRPHLTEVQITLEYSMKSPMQGMLDAVTGAFEKCVNRQLQRIQGHFEGVCTFPAALSHQPMQFAIDQPLLAH